MKQLPTSKWFFSRILTKIGCLHGSPFFFISNFMRSCMAYISFVFIYAHNLWCVIFYVCCTRQLPFCTRSIESCFHALFLCLRIRLHICIVVMCILVKCALSVSFLSFSSILVLCFSYVCLFWKPIWRIQLVIWVTTCELRDVRALVKDDWCQCFE